MPEAGEEEINKAGKSMNTGQAKNTCEKTISRLGESLPDCRKSVNSPENRAAGIDDMHLRHEFLKNHAEALRVESGIADIDEKKPTAVVLLAVVPHLRRTNEAGAVVEDCDWEDCLFSHE